MTWTSTAPLVAGVLTLLFAALYARSSPSTLRGDWRIPAALCGLFFAFSLYAGLQEGATGFWPEHVRHLWGNQIWFDLLLAASVALFLLTPKAKALGINPLPWALLTVATGSIGLLAFLAYVLWRQGQSCSE